MKPKHELILIMLSFLSVVLPMFLVKTFEFNLFYVETFEQYLLQIIALSIGYFLLKDVYRTCYRYMKRDE